jgi:DHA1 family multidrug resistance protein-like MFS transporter
MFNGMGIQWASTLLGCVAALLVPIPIAFYIWGPRIRKKSAYAPTDLIPPAAPVDEEKGVENGETLVRDGHANGNGV